MNHNENGTVAFVDVTVVDWDNLEEGGRDAFAELTTDGQAYVLRHDPDFQLRYEDAEAQP